MRIFLKLDPAVVSASLRTHISSGSVGISAVAHDVHLFTFEPSELIHAQNLLSQHPETYGRNLLIYLANPVTHLKLFGGTETELSLGVGDADFKRKMSEDFGASLAGLIMNRAYGVKWTSVLQVPKNAKLSSTRPDFQGFDSAGATYFFEAKGSTSVATTENQISAGKDQVKKYPQSATGKFVIASYISGESDIFPSTTFVIDPPNADQGIESEDTARRLHYIHILHFFGLHDQAEQYRAVLAEEFKAAEKVIYFQRSTKYRASKEAYEKSWQSLPEISEETIRGVQYVVRIEAARFGTGVIFVKRGIEKLVWDAIRTLAATAPNREGKNYATRDMSVFDDGTLMQLTYPVENAAPTLC